MRCAKSRFGLRTSTFESPSGAPGGRFLLCFRLFCVDERGLVSWLRIDDRFSRHPKVTLLTYKERWVWIDLLCWCASYQSGGYLPDNIGDLVVGATPKYLAKCSALELVDVAAGELKIHDWETYAPKDPTAAERQASWRRRKRNGDVTVPVTQDVTDGSSTSRVGTRARPVPSCPKELPKAVTSYEGTAQDQAIGQIIDVSLREAS